MKNDVFSNLNYVLSKTWKYERKIVWIIIIQVLIGITIPLIGLYLPAVMLEGVTNTLVNRNAAIRTVLILAGILILCNCMNVYIHSVYETYLLNNKIHFLTDLFRKKMELSYAFIESLPGQKMYEHAMFHLLNDNQGISGMLRCIGALLSDVCSILLYTGIIAVLDIRIMLILILTSSLHLLILRKVLIKQHIHRESLIDTDKQMNYLFGYIQKAEHNKDIKMFSMQNWLSSVVDILINKRVIWAKKMAGYHMLAAAIDIGLLVIRDGIAYIYVINAILKSQIEISQFIFYFGAITGFSVFVTGVTSSFAIFSQKNREVSSFREYVEMNESILSEKALSSTSNKQAFIEFEKVSFYFEDSKSYLFKDFDLIINSGERVALVGVNGAGKTTLVKLICGFYKPQAGIIRINGKDVSTMTQSQIADIFAAVFQDIYVLPISAAENIAFAEVGKDLEAIKHCVEIAGLSDKIVDVHQPVTKKLCKDGIVLSGGQLQKIAFARAAYKLLYKGASALILDEPTAALDPLAEKEFYEKYSNLTEGKTSLFISHRLASTQFCDRIVMLADGKIIEDGSHCQLLMNNGTYKEMFDLQSQYYN